MKIWVNTLVHNEESFIWYAIMSVVDYVDKVLVWDTGSTDNTVKIIHEIIKLKGDKIQFKEVEEVNEDSLTVRRQEMLESSKCDWVMVLDGDEIWSRESIKRLIDSINKYKDKEAIVVPFYNLVGDIYHYQNESAGRYKILGKMGHLQIRAVNRSVPGLHIKGTYPLEGFYDSKDKLLQESSNIVLVEAKYFHATHLLRSSKARKYRKEKYDLGIRFPANFQFPEVFYEKAPSVVPSPWAKRSFSLFLISLCLYPFLSVKRILENFYLTLNK